MGFNQMPPMSHARKAMEGRGVVTVEEVYKTLSIDPTHVQFFANNRVLTINDEVNVDKDQWFMISNHIGG